MHLSASESSLLAALQSQRPPSTTELVAAVRARLDAVTTTVEFEADKLADGTHVLGQHVEVADRVAGAVLRGRALRLEERERRGREREGAVGVRDTLRGLSRILER